MISSFVPIQIHDLKFYMIMLTVFILAYGVPAYSLIYGIQEFSWHLPRAILNLAYWQIFGELEVLDEIESRGILFPKHENFIFFFR